MSADPARAALRQLNEILLKDLVVGVIVVDRSYRIISMNGTARRLLGIPDVADDQDFLQLARRLPSTELRNTIDRVLRQRTVVTVPEIEANPEEVGESRWLSLHVAPAQFEGVGFECVAISVTDVSETVRLRRRVESVQEEQKHLSDELGSLSRRLTEREQLDHMKDSFLSLASHELRTPLMPLRTYAEVLSKMVEQPERGKEWVVQIREVVGKFQRQIDHMARLADDLLDVARVESGRLSMTKKPVDLKSILSTAIETAANRAPKPPPVRFSAPDLPRKVVVQGDEERLVQVIVNLLVNAGHHAAQSPHVDLHLTIVEDDGDLQARVTVRDYGPGIAPEKQGALFTRFTKGPNDRASGSGLGLGLYIARGIVQQHGGEIRVESVPGQGATFVLDLPLAEKLAAC